MASIFTKITLKRVKIHYKLDKDNIPIPCDLNEWGFSYQSLEGQKKRRVGIDNVDGIKISTVFLGLDHNYFGGKPLLFETMVFNSKGNDIYCKRYSTWLEAEKGHKEAIQWVKDGCYDD